MPRKLLLALPAAALLLAGVAHPADAAAKTFKNCTEMHKTYKHGVGRPGAKDKTSGKPVTTFKVDKATYDKNTKSDADKDGIACEKA